uniref:Uncharacterized protein n=1 Tax=Vespula pensylvanica TaxID=30213 RepID=A0A834P135_VESPE|nr:hypothetical protein H0235_009059 [Vespula pensylvanica]
MASYIGIEGLDSPFGVSEVCTTSDRRREREKGDSFHGGGGGGGEVEGMEKGKIAILKLLLIVWRPWQTSSRYFELRTSRRRVDGTDPRQVTQKNSIWPMSRVSLCLSKGNEITFPLCLGTFAFESEANTNIYPRFNETLSVDAKSRRVETNSQTKYYQEGACRKGPTEQKQTPASISHPPTILATTSLAATYGNLSEGSNTGWWNHCYRGVLVDVAETPESHLSGICERQQREKNALGH